jgi:hypothetical protein
MLEAYELLADSTDATTQLLAVDLALGAAGVESALTSVIAGIAGGGDPETVISDAFDAMTEADLALLVEAAELLGQADDTVQPSAEQYAFVAIGLIAAAADDAGGLDNINPPPADSDAESYTEQANTFLDIALDLLEAEGDSSSTLENFGDLIS